MKKLLSYIYIYERRFQFTRNFLRGKWGDNYLVVASDVYA